MWACVILVHYDHRAPTRIYSSLFSPSEGQKAIDYARGKPGIVAVESAHAKLPPIWTREKGLTPQGKEQGYV